MDVIGNLRLPFSGNGEIKNAVIERMTTVEIAALSGATELVAGRVIYDETTNLYNYYTGTAWISLLPTSGGTMTGAIDMGSNKITSLAAPVDPGDAVNLTTLMSYVAGLSWKAPARVIISTPVVIAGDVMGSAYNKNGVTLADGDRVLLTGQTLPKENGIYVVEITTTTIPDDTATFTRATDADTDEELASAAIFITEGTAYHDTCWVCTNDVGISLGTDDIVFVQFNGVVTLSSLSDVSLGTLAKGNALIYNGATAWENKAFHFVYDGTSAAALTHTVTHNLGQQYCQVVVVDESNYVVIPESIQFTSTSALEVKFTVATKCRVIVTGIALT